MRITRTRARKPIADAPIVNLEYATAADPTLPHFVVVTCGAALLGSPDHKVAFTLDEAERLAGFFARYLTNPADRADVALGVLAKRLADRRAAKVKRS